MSKCIYENCNKPAIFNDNTLCRAHQHSAENNSAPSSYSPELSEEEKEIHARKVLYEEKRRNSEPYFPTPFDMICAIIRTFFYPPPPPADDDFVFPEVWGNKTRDQPPPKKDITTLDIGAC
jgi:hypothetical protein